jgi:hypothetical protein
MGDEGGAETRGEMNRDKTEGAEKGQARGPKEKKKKKSRRGRMV